MRGVRFVATLAVFVLGGFGQAAFSQGPPTVQETPTPAPDVRARGGRRFQGVGGTITAIQGNQFVVKTRDGKTVNVELSEKTRFRKDGQDAKLSDFKVGDPVLVRGEPVGENAWVAEIVVSRPNFPEQFRQGLGKQFIAGEIKAIEGTKLTILRVDGETQVIEVNENTSFRKQGESVTLADLKPGDQVHGRGELKDGVFVPEVLNVGELMRSPMRGPRVPSSPRP